MPRRFIQACAIINVAYWGVAFWLYDDVGVRMACLAATFWAIEYLRVTTKGGIGP